MSSDRISSLGEGVINNTLIQLIGGYLHKNFREQESQRPKKVKSFYYSKINATHQFSILNFIRGRLRRLLDSEQLELLIKFSTGKPVDRQRFNALLYLIEYFTTRLIVDNRDHFKNETWFFLPVKFRGFTQSVPVVKKISNDEVIRICDEYLVPLNEQRAFKSISQINKEKKKHWHARQRMIRRKDGEPTDFWSFEPVQISINYS